jgi:hypothetical protein
MSVSVTISLILFVVGEKGDIKLREREKEKGRKRKKKREKSN